MTEENHVLSLLVDNEPNVRDSYIEIAGNECELRIPSGSESGLKLIRGFTLPEQGALALRKLLDEQRGQVAEVEALQGRVAALEAEVADAKAGRRPRRPACAVDWCALESQRGSTYCHAHAARSFSALAQAGSLSRKAHAQYRKGRVY
jgi:hypothetical protein